MRGIFVCGIDTAVGKTMVCGFLAKYLQEKGYDAVTQKWIQTGSAKDTLTDIDVHLRLTGKDKESIKEFFPYLCPYIFKAPCSPHLAAKMENKRISAGKIINSYNSLSKRFDFVIVEGIGGVLVPFNKKQLVIDIVGRLGLSVLVVVQNRLGAINHTLLTIEALKKRKLKILGLLFNNAKQCDSFILKDNPEIIKAITQERVFGTLPWVDNPDRLYNDFIPIGERICRAIGI